MNELGLSTNLNEIELEIKWHKENAGKSIWEIGRRLNHVKENDLAHGQFSTWLKRVEIDHSTANRFMKVAEEIPHSAPVQNLGYSVLYLIATLPEEQKEIELKKANRGDPSTRRELEEVKRKLKEKESQLERAEQSEQIAIEKLEREQNKKPEVIEKEVEPKDYEEIKRTKQQLEETNKRLLNELGHIEKRNEVIEKEYQELVRQRNESEEDSEKYRQLNEEMKRMNNQLTDGQKKLKAQKEVYDLVRKANQLIVETAPLTYLVDTENILDNEYARKPIEKIIDNLRDMADRLDTSITQNIYEGEIISD